MALTCLGALAENATLSVQGVGVVTLDADRATICVGVRELAPEVAEAQALVNERIGAVINAMLGMGIASEDISTNAVSIYPNYDYSGDVERIVGYVAYNSILVVTSDIESVGSYIDAAFVAGANSLDYVEFSASDTSEAGMQALRLAVQQAQKKAEVLAEASGMRLGPITDICESSVNVYDLPSVYAEEDAGSGKGAGTQVLASQLRVTAAVNVTYELSGE